MDDYIYYIELYDLYSELLTKKQKDYFEDYYFKNLSLAEIAENYEISRNAIYNQLKIVKKELSKYEEKLKLRNKFNRIDKLLSEDENSKKIRDIINE